MENFFLWAGGGGAVCTAHSRLSSTRRNASGILVAAVELTFMMRRRVHGGVEHAREVRVERGP